MKILLHPVGEVSKFTGQQYLISGDFKIVPECQWCGEHVDVESEHVKITSDMVDPTYWHPECYEQATEESGGDQDFEYAPFINERPNK